MNSHFQSSETTWTSSAGWSDSSGTAGSSLCDPIQITPRNHNITEMACRKCHAEITASIDPSHSASPEGGLQCTKCHNDVGHIE